MSSKNTSPFAELHEQGEFARIWPDFGVGAPSFAQFCAKGGNFRRLASRGNRSSAGSLATRLAAFRRREWRLARCSNPSHHIRLSEAPPQHVVGQTGIDTVGHSTSLGCQFVGAFEANQRIERE